MEHPRDLRMELDRDSRVPLPEQVVRAVRHSIVSGLHAPGERLPSARTLAAGLGVSRGTVDTAYEQLAAEGYIVQRSRSGTFVDPVLPLRSRSTMLTPTSILSQAPASTPAWTPTPAPALGSGDRGRGSPGAPAAVPTTEQTPVRLDLRPGQGGRPPMDEPLFRAAWRRALDARPAPIDPLGQPQLRHAIAEHLRVMRGMIVDPEQIVVSGGSRNGLSTVLTALDAGSVGVEEPGFPGLRTALDPVRPIPVPTAGDEESIAALDAALARSGPAEAPAGYRWAVLIAPNHQFPHGTAMSAARRAALSSWAADRGVLVLEDDYDSESRYLTPAVPPLFDTSPPGTVVHIGTFSTVLTRTVGTGYVIAGTDAGDRIWSLRRRLGPSVPPVMQLALAEYLSAGGLRRRLARARRRMRAAEAVLAERPPIPGLVPGARTIVLEMSERAAQALRDRLRRTGILVGDLSSGWTGPVPRHGLVIAYAAAGAEELREVLDIIDAAVGAGRHMGG